MIACLSNLAPQDYFLLGHLSLSVAIESFISTNQINMNGANNTRTTNKNKLLNSILQHKSIDLSAAKLEAQEAQQIQ